jgi:hypothetical protein
MGKGKEKGAGRFLETWAEIELGCQKNGKRFLEFGSRSLATDLNLNEMNFEITFEIKGF